jgi:hypothetical protein
LRRAGIRQGWFFAQQLLLDPWQIARDTRSSWTKRSAAYQLESHAAGEEGANASA